MSSKIKRRDFLAAAGALATIGVSRAASWAADIPPDLRITRIVGFDVVSRRPKMVGKNSRLDVHGDRATDRMVRIYTNAGIEGIGNCRAEQGRLRPLLGKSVAELAGPLAAQAALGNGTMPIWDLAGKILGKPAYEQLGGKGPPQIKVYDGSIYFADLLPENAAAPLDRFKKEIDMGLAIGHRAFKIKIGRGAKWMPAREGYARDVEVLKTIRAHAGPDILLGVDANNGYDLAGTKRLLGELPDFKFAFVEEMFPEKVDDCLALKAFIREQRLADAARRRRDAKSSLSAFKPFIEHRAIDVLQGDMNHFGFEGILTEAASARPAGIQSRAAQLGLADRILHAAARRPGDNESVHGRARSFHQRRDHRRRLQNS